MHYHVGERRPFNFWFGYFWHFILEMIFCIKPYWGFPKVTVKLWVWPWMTLTYKQYQLILVQLFRLFAMLGLLNSWSLLIIAFQIQDDIFSVLLFQGRSRVLCRELSQMFRLIKVLFLLRPLSAGFISRIPTVKLKIREKAILKSETITSVIFKL